MEVPRRNVLEKVASKVRKTVMGKKKLSEEEAASYEALKKKTPQQAGKPVNQGDYSRDPTAEELQKIMKEVRNVLNSKTFAGSFTFLSQQHHHPHHRELKDLALKTGPVQIFN